MSNLSEVVVVEVALPATVIFDIWGQRATTTFDAASELDPLTWLLTVYDKGFMYPFKVIGADGAVLDRDAIRAFLIEK